MVKDSMVGHGTGIKYALLRKGKIKSNRDRLELLLALNNWEGTNKEYDLIGNIKFESSFTLKELIENFSEKYVGGKEWQNPLAGKVGVAIVYPISFIPTIAPAFERYFSK